MATASSSKSRHAQDSLQDDDDGLTYFTDSLSSLFDVHTPSRGTPGSQLVYSHPLLPPPSITYGIPDHDGANTKLFAHYQWDAGWELTNELVVGSSKGRGWADVRGKTCLELGAGTGLPSLVAKRMGAKKVVVTDYPDEGILHNLSRNAAGGSRLGEGAGEEVVTVRGLAWGNEEQEDDLLSLQPSGYDRILIADTLWVSSSHPLLLHSLLRLVGRKDGRVLVAAGYHSGVPCVRRFFEACGNGIPGMGRLLPEEQEQEGARRAGIWERNVQIGKDEPCPWYGKAGDDDGGMGSIEDRAKRCVMASLRWIDDEGDGQ